MTTSDPHGRPSETSSSPSGGNPHQSGGFPHQSGAAPHQSGAAPQPGTYRQRYGRPVSSPGDGPPDPPDQPPRRRSGLTLIALAVAVLALLLGAVAAAQSWRAADKASQALDRVDGLATQPTVAPPTPAATAETPTGEPSPDPTTEAPDPNATGTAPALNAQTQYKERYTDQNLRVPADCDATINIDLDEPRVKVDSSLAEFHFYDPCTTGAAYVNLGTGVEGSLVTSSAVTPVECAEDIRTSPMSSDNQPVRRGQVYCMKTSLDAARASAGTWKMVLVEVTATGQDGTVTFKASAWDIPD